MFLFKFLFKLFFGILIFFLIVVVIPIAIMWKSVTPPEVESTTFDLESMIIEEIEYLTDDSNTDKTIGIGLDENLINNEIKKAIVESMKDNLTDDEGYVATFGDDRVMLQGAWVELSEDTIDIQVGLHIDTSILIFKTRVLVRIKILEIGTERIELQINKINIGNLPLRWIVRYAPGVAKTLFSFDIDKMINDAIDGIGTYDRKKVSITVNIDELLADNIADDVLMQHLFNIITENELVGIEIVEEEDSTEIQAQIDLNKLKSNKTPIVLTESQRIKTEAEFNTFMQNKVFASAISGKVTLNNIELSRIIDYFAVTDKNVNYLMKQAVYEDYEVVVLAPYFEIGEKATLNVPIQFGKDGNYFKTNISIDIEFAKVDNDLVLSFNNTNIGELALEDEMLSELLGEFDGFEITDMKYTVTNFFKEFSDYGANIEEVVVTNNRLEIILEENQFSGILDDIVDNFSNQEMVDKATEILDKIDNNENIDNDIEELIEDFENLSETEQQELMDILEGYLP